MAIMKILTYPDPVLSQPCREVECVKRSMVELAESMVETMYDSLGIGLAAPQVGNIQRLVVIDIKRDGIDKAPIFLFNPRIVATVGKTIYEEGCLSVPNLVAEVTRSFRVVVEALDRENSPIIISAEGLLAICLQHELDHLEGRLFLDRISPLKRSLYKKRCLKQLKNIL